MKDTQGLYIEKYKAFLRYIKQNLNSQSKGWQTTNSKLLFTAHKLRRAFPFLKSCKRKRKETL